jgi:hypothetical protein
MSRTVSIRESLAETRLRSIQPCQSGRLAAKELPFVQRMASAEPLSTAALKTSSASVKLWPFHVRLA